VFSALLDACVLVPSLKRDVLLEVAERGVYRPLWSTEILDETLRAVVRINAKLGKPADVTDNYVRRLLAPMEQAFPDALVAGWETIARRSSCPTQEIVTSSQPPSSGAPM
jgi:hypothetical protein